MYIRTCIPCEDCLVQHSCLGRECPFFLSAGSGRLICAEPKNRSIFMSDWLVHEGMHHFSTKTWHPCMTSFFRGFLCGWTCMCRKLALAMHLFSLCTYFHAGGNPGYKWSWRQRLPSRHTPGRDWLVSCAQGAGSAISFYQEHRCRHVNTYETDRGIS